MTKSQLIDRLEKLKQTWRLMMQDWIFQQECVKPGSPENIQLAESNVSAFQIRARLKYRFGWADPDYKGYMV